MSQRILCQCLGAILGCLFALPAFALSVNDQLFVAIDQCDLPKMEFLLNSGAETESLFDLEALRGSVYMHSSADATALVYAQESTCGKTLEHFANVAAMEAFWKAKITQMIDLLMRHGADPAHPVKNHKNVAHPTLHHGFYLDFPTARGLYAFKQMVKNGASPHLLDEEGNNVLFSFAKAGATEQQWEEMFATGVRYTQKHPNGNSHVRGFPLYGWSDSFVIRLMNQFRNEGFNYNSASYTDLDPEDFFLISHPLVRGYGVFSNVWENRPLYNQQLAQFKNLLIPFMRDTWDMPSSKKEIPAIAHMFMLGCPTTEFSDMFTFSFRRPYESTDTDESASRNEGYKLLRYLLKTETMNLRATDSDGKSVLSYAIHLCPFEVVQDIIVKDPQTMNSVSVNNLVEQFSGLKKNNGKLTIFNNDHRTLKLLTEHGLSVKDLNFQLLGIRNTQILNSQPKLQWQPLGNEGLDLNKGVALEVRSQHIFQRYTDIKETVVSLKNLRGAKSFRFTGKPISVSVADVNFRTAERNFQTFEDTRGVDYHVVGNVLRFKFKGGFEHSGEVNLTEIELTNNVALIFRETRSLATEITTQTFNDRVELRRDQRVNLSRKNDIVLTSNLSLRYVGFDKLVGCTKSICEALKVQKEGLDAYISLDERALASKLPSLFKIWNYLHLLVQDRKAFLVELSRSSNPKTLSYLLDLIRPEVTNAWQEEEALAIVDVVAGLAIDGKLPFDETPFLTQIGALRGLSPSGNARIATVHYILTGAGEAQAYQAITSSFYQLEQYILWKKSLTPVGSAQTRVEGLSNKIIANLHQISTALSLTPQQVSQISGLIYAQ